jgi:hypothetical protein
MDRGAMTCDNVDIAKERIKRKKKKKKGMGQNFGTCDGAYSCGV